VPAFALETEWDLGQVMNYLTTWSSVQRYKDHSGRDPLPALREQLLEVWPGEVRRVRWPIHVRLGRA
jgi:hypothetical protein